MAPTNKQVLDKLTSLESLLEAGLRECQKTRKMIQGGASAPPTGLKKRVDDAEIIKAAAIAVKKRNDFIKRKTQAV